MPSLSPTTHTSSLTEHDSLLGDSPQQRSDVLNSLDTSHGSTHLDNNRRTSFEQQQQQQQQKRRHINDSTYYTTATRPSRTSSVSSSTYRDPTAIMAGHRRFLFLQEMPTSKLQKLASLYANLYTPYFFVSSCLFVLLMGLYIDFFVDIWRDGISGKIIQMHQEGGFWGDFLLILLMVFALFIYVIPFCLCILANLTNIFLDYVHERQRYPFMRYEWSFVTFFPLQMYLPHLWMPGFFLVAFVKIVLVNNFFPSTSIPITLILVLFVNSITSVGLLVNPILWWFYIDRYLRRHLSGWLAILIHIGFSLISFFAQVYGMLIALKVDGFRFIQQWTFSLHLNMALYTFCGLMILFCAISLLVAIIKRKYVPFVIGLVVAWILLLATWVPAIVLFACEMDGVLKFPISVVLIPLEVFHVLCLLIYIGFKVVWSQLGSR